MMHIARILLGSAVILLISILVGEALILPPFPLKTFIHEFPHARVSIHYHPHGTNDQQDPTLASITKALIKGVHEIELDLRYRPKDQQVVANHGGLRDDSPTLQQILDRTIDFQRREGRNRATIQGDNRQFILVLEPKDKAHKDCSFAGLFKDCLFVGLFNFLKANESLLSTSVGPHDGPRGLTVVITGDLRDEFYKEFASQGLNRLAIIEDHDYSAEIINLRPTISRVFQRMFTPLLAV